MPANRKFIVWDWNGTLLDDAAAILVAVNAVFAAFDRTPLSMEEFRSLSGKPLSRFYAAAGFDEAQRPASGAVLDSSRVGGVG